MTTQPSQGAIPAWTIGDRMRKAREHAELSQQELADAIGLGRATISNYEVGVTPPKRPVLLSWSLACGVSLAWLETGAVIPKPDGDGAVGVLPAGSWFESKRGSGAVLDLIASSSVLPRPLAA